MRSGSTELREYDALPGSNQQGRGIRRRHGSQDGSRRHARAWRDVGRSLSRGRVCCPGDIRMPSEPLDRENYEHLDENPVKLVSEHPVSTFSIDVDTGSYSNIGGS